jgi:hypothetical protein
MSTSIDPSKPCPICGRLLPKGVLGGLCPACLIDQGGETEDGGTRISQRFEPPSIERIAGLFPQLELSALL